MASGQGLHCLLTEISMENAVKMKTSTKTPKTRNGLIQMIRMDKSTGQKCKPHFERASKQEVTKVVPLVNMTVNMDMYP